MQGHPSTAYFLSDLQHTRRLTASQQRRAKRQVEQGSTTALHQLLITGIPWLLASAAKGAAGVDEFLDLVQEGFFGLLRAIRTWDPDRSPLQSYATYWIWNHMSRFKASRGTVVQLPIHAYDRLQRLKRILADADFGTPEIGGAEGAAGAKGAAEAAGADRAAGAAGADGAEGATGIMAATSRAAAGGKDAAAWGLNWEAAAEIAATDLASLLPPLSLHTDLTKWRRLPMVEQVFDRVEPPLADGGLWFEAAAVDTTAADKVVDRIYHEQVGRWFAAFPMSARERFIMEQRLGFDGTPRTLQAIADELGVTRERVRQIQARVIRRMRTSRQRQELHPEPPPT